MTNRWIDKHGTIYLKPGKGRWPCDGRSMSILRHPTLFRRIGFTYGSAGFRFRLPKYGPMVFTDRPSHVIPRRDAA